MSDWNLKNDLALFDIHLPERFSLDEWAGKLKNRPLQNTALITGVATALFYLAEREHNPKVNSIYDAAFYCSTCLSVGYGDIFAHTAVGKSIGTVLMTIGPALANSTIEGLPAPPDTTQYQILQTLNEILDQLRRNRAEPA